MVRISLFAAIALACLSQGTIQAGPFNLLPNPWLKSDDLCVDSCTEDWFDQDCVSSGGCCDSCYDFTPMMFGNTDFRSSLFRVIPPIQAGVPGAAYGGSVGRTKVSEWNSAKPVDRVFFNFDSYANTPLGIDIDVERMLFGFEKTFLDGRASLMVRVPFAASHVSGVQTVSQISRSDVELGSVDLTAKYLLVDRKDFSLSTGVLVGLPTNSDAVIDIVRFENNSIQVTPFFAALYETGNWFAQGFTSVAMDANGSRVSSQGAPVPGVRHREQQVLDLDLQIGYWAIKDQCTGRGLAPFVEFHYTSPISSRDDLFNFAPGLEQGDFDDYVMGTGIQFMNGKNLTGAVAINLPLSNEERRSADYQIGFRVEYRR